MVNAPRVWLWVFLCWEDQDLSQVSGPCGFQLIEMKHSRREWDLTTKDSKRQKKNQAAIIPLLMMEGWLKSAIYGFHSESSSARSVPASPELPILSHTFALKLQFLVPEHLRSINCSRSFCSKDEFGVINARWARQNVLLYFKIEMKSKLSRGGRSLYIQIYCVYCDFLLMLTDDWQEKHSISTLFTQQDFGVYFLMQLDTF